MDALAIYRKALEGAVTKVDGGRPGKSIAQTIQKKLKPHYAETLSLPVRYMPPAQDLDPESETFGLLYFVLGVDALGDPSHPLA